MRKSIPMVLIILFVLMACTNQTETISSVTPLVDGVTQTPSLTPSPTSLPTKSPKPTSTKTSTPEPSPTIPPSTVAAQSTLESLADEFPELESSYWYGSISPSGTWAAFSFSDFTKQRDVLILAEIDSKKTWEICFSDGCSPYFYGIHSGAAGIDHWSKNNRHVYLVSYPEWDGPGLWFTSGGANLIRFNLIDGSWVDMNVGSSWSFSGDEKYLVYFAKDGVHLRTMLDGSEYIISIPEKFENLGRFVWSPDNTKFAFTATYGEWYEGKTGFSAFVFNINNLSMQTLFEDDFRLLYSVDWIESERITLYQFNTDDVYFFDLTTNQIIPTSLQ